MIRRILRHSNISTTQAYYIKTSGKDVQKAMTTLETSIPEGLLTGWDTVRTPLDAFESNRSTLQ